MVSMVRSFDWSVVTLRWLLKARSFSTALYYVLGYSFPEYRIRLQIFKRPVHLDLALWKTSAIIFQNAKITISCKNKGHTYRLNGKQLKVEIWKCWIMFIEKVIKTPLSLIDTSIGLLWYIFTHNYFLLTFSYDFQVYFYIFLLFTIV